MRTPTNETLTPSDKPEHRTPRHRAAASEPVRKCVLSGDHGASDRLVRLVLSPDGEVLPDVRAKAPGRGAWIGVSRVELEAAVAKKRLRGALARGFKTGDLRIPEDLPQRIEAALQRDALDRLGLEARSGNLVTGAEKIATAARQGRLHLLIHAADAGADGAGKLAQAWRVGSDAQGSGIRGLALPVNRTILSLALGRENVVHAGLTDARAARRAGTALDRWLHFIGPECVNAPCEARSQGASAFDGSAGDEAVKTKDFE